MLSWNDLSIEANTNVMLAVMNITLNVCQNSGSLIADLRKLEPADLRFQRCCVKWNETVGVEAPHLTCADLRQKSDLVALDHSCEKSLRNVNETALGSSLEMQMVLAACDPGKLIEDLQDIFGFSDAASNIQAVATSVVSAMCLSHGVAREIKEGYLCNQKALVSIRC
jgi:hypothetical protein